MSGQIIIAAIHHNSIPAQQVPGFLETMTLPMNYHHMLPYKSVDVLVQRAGTHVYN